MALRRPAQRINFPPDRDADIQAITDKVWCYRPGVEGQESEWGKLAAASSRVPP